MAYIVNYNPSEHDLYKYISGPTIDPKNYSNNVAVYGFSYNNDLWIKKPVYGLSGNVDFSGIDVRPRGAPSYGFDTWANSDPSGISYVNGVLSYPNAISFLNGYQNIETCYFPGCPTGNFNRASNYNYWNNGTFAKILISPKHFISTLHFAGNAVNLTAYFLGKDGTLYTKTASKKFNFNYGSAFSGNTFPTGYDWPAQPFAQDWCLFELDTAFTELQLNNVKIYKFANLASIPPELPIYLLNPQSVVTTRKRGNASILNYASFSNLSFNFDPNVSTTVPYYGYEDLTDEVASNGYVWSGDSGTPSLVYDSNTNETYFLSLLSGGGGIFDNSIDPGLYPTMGDGKILFDALQKYIQDQIGYTIGIANISTAQPLPVGPTGSSPYPETLFINGKTFYLQISQIPPNTKNIELGIVAPGYTYDFAIISYNSNGYCGYAHIENFYLPYST
jgi:hypothetical protein